MVLSQQEIMQLNDALLSAYDIASLDRMLFLQLGKDLESIAGSGTTLLGKITAVIRQAEREGWTDTLVYAAHDANSGNLKLKEFTDQYLRFEGSASALERVIEKSNSFLDIATWRSKLAKIERKVCSIEIGGSHFGTGFLIDANLVMTNYHVIEELLGESPKYLPEQVRIRFDFKKSDDGNVLNDGVRYGLVTDDWIIDYSPYSPLDGTNTQQVPSLDELDYAILQVASTAHETNSPVLPGMESIVGSPDGVRGWLKLSSKPFQFQKGQPLFIVQHPSGAPLKMALDTDAIETVNSNRTRVKYTTNTEPGSSGSPCFNSEWELIALHHVGDPNWKNPRWNQGIPIDTIVQCLENKLPLFDN